MITSTALAKAQTKSAALINLSVHANQLMESLLDRKSRPSHMIQWLQEFSEVVDCLPLSTAEYGLAKIRIICDQNRLRAFIMFCLAKKVDSDPIGIIVCVGDD